VSRARNFLLGGPVSGLLVGVMLAGSLLLWVGIPLGWLWIGSQVQASSSSIGTGLMVTMVGAISSIIFVAWLLSQVNRKHVELREARDLPMGSDSALEVILVVSAGIAVVAFSVWFFGFSGSSPVPLNVSY
jgi:ABC-type uncharacterized transport system permease subunit